MLSQGAVVQPNRLSILFTSVAVTGVLAGCPTLPPSVDLPAEPESVLAPDVGEPEAPEPEQQPEAVEPEGTEPEGPVGETNACAVVPEARLELLDPSVFNAIYEPGGLERGPGGLTRSGDGFGAAVFNPFEGPQWSLQNPGFIDFNQDWSQVLAVDDRALVKEDVISGETLWSVPAPDSPAPDSTFVRGVALSDDDRTAIVLHCWSTFENDQREDGAILTAVDFATGEVRAQHPFEGCGDQWRTRTLVHLADGGAGGVLVGVPEGSATPFSVDFGPGASFPLEVDDDEDPNVPNNGGFVLAADLSPDGRNLVVTTADNMLRLYDATLGTLKWEAPVGRFEVNRNTYLWVDTSPVTFSADGSALVMTEPAGPAPQDPNAATDESATLTVVNVATGERVTALTIPTPIYGSLSPAGYAPGAPTGLLYDEHGLTVTLEGGHAHFDCQQADGREGPAPLSLTVTAPATVSRASPNIDITVTTPAAAGPAVRGAVGEHLSWSPGTLSDTLSVGLYTEEGVEETTLTIFVDNGFEMVAEDITLQIVP